MFLGHELYVDQFFLGSDSQERAKRRGLVKATNILGKTRVSKVSSATVLKRIV